MSRAIAFKATEQTAQMTGKSKIPKSPRPIPKQRASRRSKPSENKRLTRDDLTFTGRFGEHGIMNNWLPFEVPAQNNQWGIGYELGKKMLLEVVALQRQNEEDAYNALRFAPIAKTWKVGGRGVESGFSESLAALAIVGMRYIELGAAPYNCDEPETHKPWTATELIAKNLKEAKKKTGSLFDRCIGQSEGAIAAFLNVGLIDQATYFKAYRELIELCESRKNAQGRVE